MILPAKVPPAGFLRQVLGVVEQVVDKAEKFPCRSAAVRVGVLSHPRSAVLPRSLIRGKEKKFVLNDRSAHRSTKLVALKDRGGG